MAYVVVQRVELTFQAVRRMQRLVLWLMDLPARGTHIGGGRHVDMPETIPDPPPQNGVYKGWTTRYLRWVRHPDNDGSDTDQWAILVTPELQAAWIAKRGRLSQAVRDWVQSHLASAADLGAEWRPGGVLDTSEDILPEPTP